MAIVVADRESKRSERAALDIGKTIACLMGIEKTIGVCRFDQCGGGSRCRQSGMRRPQQEHHHHHYNNHHVHHSNHHHQHHHHHHGSSASPTRSRQIHDKVIVTSYNLFTHNLRIIDTLLKHCKRLLYEVGRHNSSRNGLVKLPM